MAEEVHVGKGGRKSQKPRWQFVVALAAVVVLALGAGLVVRWIVDRNNKPADTPSELAPEIQEVQDLVLDNKPEEAEKKINEVLADPNVSSDVKFTLYPQQAANYFQKGDYQKALELYMEAFKIRETSSLAQSIASTWRELGGKQQAIQYFQRAIELMPQNNPVRDDEIQLIEEQIKKLESGS